MCHLSSSSYYIMRDLCHMIVMTDHIYNILTKGLWVSMEAYWPQESGLWLQKHLENCFQPKKWKNPAQPVSSLWSGSLKNEGKLGLQNINYLHFTMSRQRKVCKNQNYVKNGKHFLWIPKLVKVDNKSKKDQTILDTKVHLLPSCKTHYRGEECLFFTSYV